VFHTNPTPQPEHASENVATEKFTWPRVAKFPSSSDFLPKRLDTLFRHGIDADS
jgi:hypothetical protein